MAEWLHRGGPGMLWISMLALPVIVVALVHVLARTSWSGRLGVGLVAVVLLVGGYATYRDFARVDDALFAVSPADRQMMLREGNAEAVLPIEYACGVALAAGVLLAIGHLRRRGARAGQ